MRAAERDKPHSHPCNHCKTAVECHGHWSYNHDGWPETWCDDYHKLTGMFLCEDCDRLFKLPGCDDCGEPGATVTAEDSDDASGYRGDSYFCGSCWEKRMEQRR